MAPSVADPPDPVPSPAGVALPLAEATLDILATALGVPDGAENRHRRTGLA